ncbi:MAG: UDP-N-acetylmuramoyl-L-alanine--D-glutamate ligase [Candidatus Omnitrophota bacterium]|nr:MAG: UDP-N-acetylmuramoyl-L-alanine--D-glutamate ligase [Candidatus Omnitrophota bacterium]
MNVDNFRKICVVGWGKTGISLAYLLLSLGKKAIVTEIRESTEFPSSPIQRLKGQGVEFEFGGHSQKFIKGAELVVVSPGVDLHQSSIFDICRALNIPCVGEIEFCFWLTKAQLVAITGTNGKTTTTFLTYRALKEKRKRVFLGGNIGIPFSSLILNTKKGDLIVLEISSFQLETIIEFKPHVASILNVEPDHLDRYRSLKDYFDAKMNIFRNQTKDDWAVLNGNIALFNNAAKKINSNVIYFSSEFPNENFSCAYRIANIFGISKTDCLHVFSQFKGLPHRLQLVRKLGNISFINDSKATNPSSTIWALQNIKGNIILVAGGKDKGVDYSVIAPYLKKVKKLNLLGEASYQIKEALTSHVDTEVFSSLNEAIVASFKEANPGDTVLFSPMCSSFDMFSNYRERGNKFIEIVNNLA